MRIVRTVRQQNEPMTAQDELEYIIEQVHIANSGALLGYLDNPLQPGCVVFHPEMRRIGIVRSIDTTDASVLVLADFTGDKKASVRTGDALLYLSTVPSGQLELIHRDYIHFLALPSKKVRKLMSSDARAVYFGGTGDDSAESTENPGERGSMELD